MERSEPDKILVLGIGNDILTDDGIGPKLVNDLNKEEFSDHIEFRTAFVGGLEILELIRDYRKVIILDAIVTLKAPPGTVSVFRPGDFKETLHLSNLHDANFLTALELGKKLSMKIPEEIVIIAVEILEDRIFSNNFSAEVKAAYPSIFSDVKQIVSAVIIE